MIPRMQDYVCMPKRKMHLKDARRTRVLREYAAKVQELTDAGDEPSLQQLCEQERNVFDELGFLHPEQELLKALLSIQICGIVSELGLTQMQAAQIMGTTHHQISAMKNARFSRVSVGRMFECLTALGQDVEITIKAGKGRISVARTKGSSDGFLPRLLSLFDRKGS
jgi:predicted XRE-type DNA-binding protein